MAPLSPLLAAALLSVAAFFASPAQAAPVCENLGLPVNTGGCEIHSEAKFCRDLEECKRFCCCACAEFDSSDWHARGNCPHSPTAGGGSGLDLIELQSLTHVRVDSGARATEEVRRGLERLDRVLPYYQEKYPELGNFNVHVHHCYRAAHDEVENICGWVFRKMHVEQSTRQPQSVKDEWTKNAANIWGLAWPGPTPHSRGVACDMVLVDQNGDDCFGWAFVKKTPKCSIARRKALAILDEIMTGPGPADGEAAGAAVGAIRLDYEAWHYEWGSPYSSCRCKNPTECAESGEPGGSPRECRHR